MQIFMLRSKPHQIQRINEFIKDKVVSIGWTATGDLTNATKEDIRQALQSLGYTGQSLLTNLGMVNAFICTMQEGSIVLVREDEFVHIGKVGPYQWRKDYIDMHMAHTRSVTWLTKVPFKELNAPIQSLLKNIKTIARYHGTLEESGLKQYISHTHNTEYEVEPKLPIKDKESLLANTIETLKDLMNNAKDENVRLEATKELLSHLKSIN